MILEEPLLRRILGEIEIATIIKKMEGRKLKQTEKNYLYRSIRPKLIAAAIVTNAGILKEVNKNKREDTSYIEFNFGLYGYQMLLPKKKKARKMQIEELIIEILTKHPISRYIEAIPILLIKNKIDKFKLLEFASKHGIKNKIGYLIETAILIKPMTHLKEFLDYLKKNKDKETSLLVEGDPSFLAETSPKRVKKWNLLGRFFDEDFKRNAEVYL